MNVKIFIRTCDIIEEKEAGQDKSLKRKIKKYMYLIYIKKNKRS